MSAQPADIGIASVEELLSHAVALEVEAQQRYTELADAMETHNNFEVSALFRRMAELEGMHLESVETLGDGYDIQPLKPWDYKWSAPDEEGPETTPIGEGHYLMHPHDALKLALHNEQRAARYFQAIADQARTPELRAMALELAEEETTHAKWLTEWLAKTPEPEEGFYDDPDPVNEPG